VYLGAKRRYLYKYSSFPFPFPKWGAEPPNFRPIFIVAKPGWMKLVLGMEVGLSPIEFVLDGDPLYPPQKGDRTPSPIFGPFLLWPNGCMHQDATWYGGRPQPRVLCIRWGFSPPNFWPMFIILIVISLEHCIIVPGLLKFKFYF